MTFHSKNPLPDLINSLEGTVKGEFRTDKVTRLLYSTDASIYQIVPMGVFYPEDLDDIQACVEAASSFNVSILPRGSGSSMAGQAIGQGLIIDCSSNLDLIIDVNPEEKTATIQPGVILATLNHSAEKFGLQFGPDPASAERATMGGTLANNAAGAHSIRYGMSADHLLSVETVLSDGSIANLEAVNLNEARRIADLATREGEIYREALIIREQYGRAIQNDWPKTWRRASGYNLNYLLPWTPSKPPQWSSFNMHHSSEPLPYPPVNDGVLNLAPLIAGSEGTLGIIRQATVRLVPKPRATCLVLLAFPDMISACEAVSSVLEIQPSAVEIIPANMMRLARTIPAYAHQVAFIEQLLLSDNSLPNLLAVEFCGESPNQVRKMGRNLIQQTSSPSLLADDPELQEQIWNVRKVGLGLLMSKPGDTKPIPFIEDVSVPIDRLGEFVQELERILQAHNTEGDFYAHASTGCLHIRPLINLKTVQGITMLREIATEAISLIIRLGGSPSGEHGDGLARSEWLDKVFGPQIGDAFRKLKQAADPAGILNPGKIIDPPAMDINLRYGPTYSAKAWQPVLDFSHQNGLVSAVELCNGAGVCRKFEGVMCPSFQATKDEMHSTRGRANLLRAMLGNHLSPEANITSREVFEALDLCLACKGCKAECPSAVDMAKLKYEFLEHYYHSRTENRRPIRDYLFAYIGELSQYGALLNPLTNYLLNNLNKIAVGERWLGISSQRNLPIIERVTLRKKWKKLNNSVNGNQDYKEKVLFLSDPFTEYYQPEIGLTALQVLTAAGCEVEIIPVIGSGRTMLSKGFVKSARQHAEKIIEAINNLDSDNQLPILGIEPSEIYTLCDEYVDLFPGRSDVESIADRAMMIDEFLIRPGIDGRPRYMRIDFLTENANTLQEKVALHGHCYQKTRPPAKDGYLSGVMATAELLERVGYKVEVLDTGCCGMAGSFGYESEHYDLSKRIGELSLFPQVRAVDGADIVSSAGFSCLAQIKDGTGKDSVHPITLISVG